MPKCCFVKGRSLVCLLCIAACLPSDAAIGQKIVPPGASAAQDVYLPLDYWVYDALDRLRGLGYLDTAFLGLRPWTARSIGKMLSDTELSDGVHDDPQAEEILIALQAEFPESAAAQPFRWQRWTLKPQSAYTRIQPIFGLPLRDSFHLGQTLANDFGRPYQKGFNTIDGISGTAQAGRLSLFVRAEYQFAPSSPGYSPGLATLLSNIDAVPTTTNPIQATIPQGPIVATNALRMVEANLSYSLLNHQISFGKSDHWMAPTQGGSFLFSNNAENIYAFQIDRTEPLHIPLISRLTGPFRYDFFVGSLKGHSDPNDPWMHLEKISFKPTSNVEIGFSRSTIWGGKGHAPITIHSFLKSFFSFQNVSYAEKISRGDPGARVGTFDFSWRIPFLTHWVTLYSDSLVHDDVSPVDAPRHAAVRPGIYLSEVPGISRLDLRVEGVNTDPPTSRSVGGGYLYTELEQPQGYTNKGYIMGDAFGREGKGGQAWATYHLSPKEMVQLSYRHFKAAKDFIPQGTTQNSFDVRVVKRFHRQWEIAADVQQEWWKAPVYQTGKQSDTAATVKFTWYPEIVLPKR